MPHHSSADDQELALWQQATQGIQRLEQRKVHLHRPSLASPISSTHTAAPMTITEYFALSEHAYLDPIAHHTVCEFKQPYVSYHILIKLRRGHYPIEVTLDLHGLTAQAARLHIDQAIYDYLCRRLQVIHIIHGKGQTLATPPVLKNKLNHWLREIPAVLAFCSATPAKGGTGALYVLLNKKDRPLE